MNARNQRINTDLPLPASLLKPGTQASRKHFQRQEEFAFSQTCAIFSGN